MRNNKFELNKELERETLEEGDSKVGDASRKELEGIADRIMEGYLERGMTRMRRLVESSPEFLKIMDSPKTELDNLFKASAMSDVIEHYEYEGGLVPKRHKYERGEIKNLVDAWIEGGEDDKEKELRRDFYKALMTDVHEEERLMKS